MTDVQEDYVQHDPLVGDLSGGSLLSASDCRLISARKSYYFDAHWCFVALRLLTGTCTYAPA